MYLYITQYCKVSTLSISAQGWLRSTHRAPSFLWWVLFYRIKKFLFFLNLHFRRNSQFFSICASFGNKISLLLRFLLESSKINMLLFVQDPSIIRPKKEEASLHPKLIQEFTIRLEIPLQVLFFCFFLTLISSLAFSQRLIMRDIPSKTAGLQVWRPFSRWWCWACAYGGMGL